MNKYFIKNKEFIDYIKAYNREKKLGGESLANEAKAEGLIKPRIKGQLTNSCYLLFDNNGKIVEAQYYVPSYNSGKYATRNEFTEANVKRGRKGMKTPENIKRLFIKSLDMDYAHNEPSKLQMISERYPEPEIDNECYFIDEKLIKKASEIITISIKNRLFFITDCQKLYLNSENINAKYRTEGYYKYEGSSFQKSLHSTIKMVTNLIINNELIDNINLLHHIAEADNEQVKRLIQDTIGYQKLYKFTSQENIVKETKTVALLLLSKPLLNRNIINDENMIKFEEIKHESVYDLLSDQPGYQDSEIIKNYHENKLERSEYELE